MSAATPPPPPAEPEEASTFPVARFAAVVLGWDALWWSAVGWFAAPVLPGGWLAVLALFVLGALPLVVLARVLRGDAYPGKAARLFALRPFWYVQLGLPLVALVALLGGVLGLFFGAGRVAGRWALVGAVAAYALFAFAGWLGSKRLVVRRFDASFPDLPEGLEGLRVVQVSDLHVGPHTPERFLRRVRDAMRAESPDLVAVTGDQVDDHDKDVERFAQAFGDVKAPLGVFAVAGNHDVYAGWDGVHAGMERMGLVVLVNDAVPVSRGGAELWVLGTGDPAGIQWRAEGGWKAAPDLEKTLARVPPGAFTLALAHNPALWPHLAQRGVRLTLSGHTHHGQVSVPALRWCLASPFLELSMGSYRRGGSLLYVNPGTNHWGIPLRLGAWPEVSVVTLRRGGETGFRRVG